MRDRKESEMISIRYFIQPEYPPLLQAFQNP